jgi:flagellar basal-body rod protein FlgB
MRVDELRTMMNLVFQNLQAAQSNLANVDTPGYKRKEVDFDEVIQDIQNHGSLLKPISDYVVTDNTTSWRLDGNNVDPDKEIVNLTQTAMWYQGISEMLSRHFSTAREVLQMLR